MVKTALRYVGNVKTMKSAITSMEAVSMDVRRGLMDKIAWMVKEHVANYTHISLSGISKKIKFEQIIHYFSK